MAPCYAKATSLSNIHEAGTPSSWQPSRAVCDREPRVATPGMPRLCAPDVSTAPAAERARAAIAVAGGPKGAALLVRGAARTSIMAPRRLTRPVDCSTDTGNCSVANARRRWRKGKAGHVDPKHLLVGRIIQAPAVERKMPPFIYLFISFPKGKLRSIFVHLLIPPAGPTSRPAPPPNPAGLLACWGQSITTSSQH